VKKWISGILAVLLAVALLAACDGSPDTGAPTLEPISPREAAPETAPTANPADEAFWALDLELFLWAEARGAALGEWGERAHARFMGECKMWPDRLSALDRDRLSPALQFAYDVYAQYFTQELAFESLLLYAEPLDLSDGPQKTLKETFVYFTLTQETDVEAYLTLLADVPRYLAEILTHEQARAAAGLFMTETALGQVSADCRAEAAQDSIDTLTETFAAQLDLMELSDALKAEYLGRQVALAQGYAGAFQALADGLYRLAGQCREPDGQRALGPQAIAYYAAALQRESGTNLSPYEALILLENYRDKTYLELETRHLLNPQLFNYDSLRGFDTPQKNLDYLLDLLSEVFRPLYAHEYKVIEVPPALRQDAPAVHFVASKCPVLAVNPDAEPDILMYAHEYYPGHLYQSVYQDTAAHMGKNTPLFSHVIAPAGYREGWAMNAARVVAERADYFGADYLLGTHYYDLFILLNCAIAGLQVNYFGYSYAQLGAYLADYGLEAMLDDIYDRAVDMPLYDFAFMLGYCAQQEIEAACQSVYALDPAAYYAHYLDLGPGYFNLLLPAMKDWARDI